MNTITHLNALPSLIYLNRRQPLFITTLNEQPLTYFTSPRYGWTVRDLEQTLLRLPASWLKRGIRAYLGKTFLWSNQTLKRKP